MPHNIYKSMIYIQMLYIHISISVNYKRIYEIKLFHFSLVTRFVILLRVYFVVKYKDNVCMRKCLKLRISNIIIRI